MAKAKTIKIWIDLWTTNSAITYNNNWNYEVIETDFQNYTPSIFWYNKWGDEVIWKQAYDDLFLLGKKWSPDNYKAEVKRLMWTSEKTHFERWNISLLPEEISAKILSYLKTSLLMKYPEADTESAVISVPAFFTTTQSEATKRAWELAWFKNVVLIQEPIAAALSYWYDNSENNNWLVYDLWGWTFDVAIISCQNWVLTVKWHAWDNFLWGKDIDNLIISKIILPKLSESFSFSSINNLFNKETYCLLKWFAEEAKKSLTKSETTKIIIDEDIIKDDNWDFVDKEISIQLDRSEFENLIWSLIDKTISLCRSAIQDSWMEPNDIDRIILVWWSTQIPLIREKIKELWIKIDTSVNPLTVVSKWACIFWSAQTVKEETKKSQLNDKSSKFEIELNYDPVVSDDDTSISWEVKWLPSNKQYYIQIQDSKQNYSSEKIRLIEWKFFIDAIPVVEKNENEFYIYLSDETWTILELTTDSFIITKWISIAWTPLSRSIYISLNRINDVWELEDYCELILEKWRILPDEYTWKYKTARWLNKDDSINILPLRIYEWDWDSLKPERNILVCDINITGKDIPYNLPKWSEVEITVKKDISWEIKLSAYFPDFDYYIEEVSRTSYDEEVNKEALYKDFNILSERYRKLSKHISEEDKRQIRLNMSEIWECIDNDDEDSKKRNQKEIRETMNLLDKVEANSQPEIVKEKYQMRLNSSKKFVKDFHEENEYLEKIMEIEKEWDNCIYEKNWHKLTYISDLLREINISLLYETSWWLKFMIEHLYGRKWESSDITKMNQIYNEALGYMDSNNIEWMRNCVFKFWDLMPDDSDWKLPFSWISKR